jgi:hypothetical protein
MYIKINEEKYPIKDFQVFTTQMGNNGIRIIGDVPIAEGFLILDDEDNVIADRSDYTYLYREDDKCKEYTAVEEEIIPTECSYMGDVPTSPIQRQISALNNRVSAITPYEASSKAYYGENYKTFYGVPSGNVSVFFDNYNGEYEVSRIEDRLTVTFPERLTDMTNVKIMVQ